MVMCPASGRRLGLGVGFFVRLGLGLGVGLGLGLPVRFVVGLFLGGLAGLAPEIGGVPAAPLQLKPCGAEHLAERGLAADGAFRELRLAHPLQELLLVA